MCHFELVQKGVCKGKYSNVMAGSLPLFGMVLSRTQTETALSPAAVCVVQLVWANTHQLCVHREYVVPCELWPFLGVRNSST